MKTYIPLKMHREWINKNLIVSYLIGSVTINLLNSIIFYQEYWTILWYCNFAAIILALGFFLNSKKLVTLILITAIPGQFLWILDIFLEFFGHGMGRSAYLFHTPWVYMISTLNVHIILIPIAWYGVKLFGFQKKMLHACILATFFFLSISYMITPFKENANCMLYSCDKDMASGLMYSIKTMVFWLIIFMTSYLFFSQISDKIFPKQKKAASIFK